MRTIFFFFTLTLAAQTPESLWRAARSRQPAPEAQQPPQLLQVSTLDALLRGLYAASYTVADLKQQGDFGVGTDSAVGIYVALIALAWAVVRRERQRDPTESP